MNKLAADINLISTRGADGKRLGALFIELLGMSSFYDGRGVCASPALLSLLIILLYCVWRQMWTMMIIPQQKPIFLGGREKFSYVRSVKCPPRI
jgi:hypothetical protein